MIKEIASNYIFGLLFSCLESDVDSLEYHDAKAALEDLRSITITVYGMVKDSGVKCPFSTVFMYCAKYQEEALEFAFRNKNFGSNGRRSYNQRD